jgi:prevent-host-death family protein
MSVVISVMEAKDRLPELLDRVEKGEEVAITREGRTVARLVSGDAGMSVDERMEKVRALADRFVALEAKANPPPADPDALDLDRLRRLSDRFVENFGRPFRSTDIDALLYDEDGLPK